jgi:hypothetical protein
LSGERNGYQRQDYGARLNPNSGLVVVLAPGETIKDVIFKLAPNAVISGRVLDQEGEPMPNIIVSALKSGYSSGKRQWTQSGAAQTTDRGEFRVANLRAGSYLVRATNLNIGIGLAGVSNDPSPAKPEPAYGATYYGNSTEMARAVAVDVRMGEVRGGTDIQMVKTATVRIKGKVAGGPEGKMLAVMLLRKGSAAAGMPPGNLGLVQQNDGTFEIKGVTPGSYLLTARAVTEATILLGALPLEVGEQHIDGIELRLAGGSELSGRASMVGKNMTVTLESLDYSLGDAPKADVGEDGEFTLKGFFIGKYRVRVSDMPQNAYVRSVKLGGQDVDESGIEWSGAPGQLDIALSGTGGRVEGVVLGLDEKPMAGATVALIPDSGRESRYASTSTDADGSFRLNGVAPGKYKVLGWEDLEPGAYQDPEFVKTFEGEAQAVSLEENGRAKIT